MADISKITLPSGTTYNIKDAQARQQIAALAGGDVVAFVGVSSTELTDGGTEIPKVNNENKTPATGQLFFYGTQEFIWGADNKWHALGSLDSLGDLAYKDNASGNYTPAGTVSKPTFTGSSSPVTITATANASGNYQPAGSISGGAFTGSNTTFTGSFTPEGSITTTTATTENKTATVSKANSGTATYTPQGSVSTPTISLKTAGETATIHNPTSVTVAKTIVAAAPGETAPSNSLTYYSVSNETLRLYQIGYTTGASITTSDQVVKTSDAAYESTQPTFTGTGARLVTGDIAVPKTYISTFAGTEGSISTSGIPNGSNGSLTFTGTKVQISGTTTALGDVSQPTFSGIQGSVTVS